MRYVATHSKLGKKIEEYIRAQRAWKHNFGKLKFQGQFLQDMIAYLYLEKANNGFYVDIGANDGISGSNTYLFESLGWEGICVEPIPNIFSLLKKYRKCDCYNVALSSTFNESVDFLIAENADALSGITECLTEDHLKFAREHGAKLKHIAVKTMTFNQIMTNYPGRTHIDFMSIDVEGHEVSILRTIDFTKYTFGFITIENNDERSIRQIMEQNGYVYFMTRGADIMFVPQNKHR
jgi:FkbM family methyltransferase